MKDQSICCPNCYTPLNDEQCQGEQFCPTCRKKYVIADGMTNFIPDDKFYWGEITQEEMVRVNQKAAQVGWYQAYSETIPQISKREMLGYLFSPIRIAGMFHYYNPQHNDACLDLGSGWGPISFGLSKFYKTVYSVDGVYERLQFQAIRAQQDQVPNVKIIRSTMLKLPFSDNTMDTVIVNGLLEWIGLSDSATDPRTLQINFLREVCRVLKPGGKLFIGIENRIGAEYFIGARDHSGLYFTNFFPRKLASLVVRLSHRGDVASIFSGAETSYRTYTYTYWGYLKLLREVGYLNPKIYWAQPSYNEPRITGSLDASSMKFFIKSYGKQINHRIKQLVFWMVEKSPNFLLNLLVKAFAPYFLIVASKGKALDGIEEMVIGVGNNISFVRSIVDTKSEGHDLEAAYILCSAGELQRNINIEPVDQ